MSEPKVKAKRVLFFDSGVGGLSVYKAVKALNPDVEAYYLFDNECFPYGNKGDHFLIKRIETSEGMPSLLQVLWLPKMWSWWRRY